MLFRSPDVPCGLQTDAERARHVRRRVVEMLNSRGEWERYPGAMEKPVAEIFFQQREDSGDLTGEKPASELPRFRLAPILKEPAALEKVGHGILCVVSENAEGPVYGRAITVADRLNEDRVILAKWVRRLVDWNGRQTSLALWREKLVPLLEAKLATQRTPVVRLVEESAKIIAEVSVAALSLRVPVDRYGVAIWKPIERDVMPPDCAVCALVAVCRDLSAVAGTASLWRRLQLVDAAGTPTRRGRIASFFSQGAGLAVAVALEDSFYPIQDLIYDLANLDAGFRFCGEENRWAGRMARACQRAYGQQSIPGYLENGVPLKYGAGAETVVQQVHKNPMNKHHWVTELLGAGDIDRIIIEWRSLLRQVSHAPDLEWERWREFQKAARAILHETESPTLTELPRLDYQQTGRVEHRLQLRRH